MMAGNYGNENLAFVQGSQTLTTDGTSDTVTIPAGVHAVDFHATKAVWVKIGEPGSTPVAAAPGAEKTVVQNSFYLADSEKITAIPIPLGNDTNQVKIAAIQSTEAGVLTITHRKFA